MLPICFQPRCYHAFTLDIKPPATMEKVPFPAASTGTRSLPTLDTKNISGIRRGDTWVGQFELPPTTAAERIWRRVKKEATFFRIHATAFVFLPLIASGVFHACNGQYHIKYIDSLFLTYSAMTVTGLSTVNLSTLTPLQQAILYVLMAIVSHSLLAITWFRYLSVRVTSRPSLGSWSSFASMLYAALSGALTADVSKGDSSAPTVNTSSGQDNVSDRALNPS